MGIQINGNTNNINAGIGSLSIEDIRELDITGIATASNFKTGTSNVHSTGYECTNVNATGVITATSFSGSGANLTGISAGTALSGSTNNTVCTVTGANAIQGEANFTYDGTIGVINGNTAGLAVGTNALVSGRPDNVLHLHKASGGTADGPTIYFTNQQTGVTGSDGFTVGINDTQSPYIWNRENTDLRFGTNNAERFRIDKDGNIGQGSATPTTPNGSNADNPNNGLVFTMYGDSPAINLVSSTTTSSDYSLINFGRTGSSTNPYRAVIGYKQSDDILRINAQNAIAFDTGGDINTGEALRINSNGSVSIANTRNYYGALNVEAGVITSGSSAIDIKASGSGSYAQAISFGDHNTISGELKIKNSTDITLGTSSNHPFVLLGNNVAGLKISNSNGRLERNFGAGSGHTADGMWFNNSVSATGYFIRFWQTSGGYGANQIGSITHSAYNTAYNTSSDYRLKENDVKISDGITRLKQLRPIRFNWKSDPSTTEDGFFAHEAAMVVPEAVTGTKDEVADSDSPDIGQKAGDPIHQGMDYGKITPLLTAALQEAITRIETLEQQKIDLEAQVAAIVDSITNK